jgi:hypothetical protein
MASAVGKKTMQAGALSREMPFFFGRKTLKFVKRWAVKPVVDKDKRGTQKGRVFLGSRRRKKTWEVVKPMRASGPGLD